MLSTGQRVKHSEGVSPLTTAVTKVAKNPCSVEVLNVNYCDTGLFGLSVAAHHKDVQAVVKAAVSKMREIAKGMNDSELAKAK